MTQPCATFLLDVERNYVEATGKRSRKADNFRLALRALLTLHRDTATKWFTIDDLIGVRQQLLDGGRTAGRDASRAPMTPSPPGRVRWNALRRPAVSECHETGSATLQTTGTREGNRDPRERPSARIRPNHEALHHTYVDRLTEGTGTQM